MQRTKSFAKTMTSGTLAAIILTAPVLALGTADLGLPTRATSPPKEAGYASLGKQLFVDKRLSSDGTISCSSCHKPDGYFADGRDRAAGIHNARGTRNAPSLLNVAFQVSLFWDGRTDSLEKQAGMPLLNAAEHGLANERDLIGRLNRIPEYVRAFGSLGEPISLAAAGRALAAYERTLVSGDSPFDRYRYGGNKHAMTAMQIRGLALFDGKAGCSGCHAIAAGYALFTDQQFHLSPAGLPQHVNSRLGALTKKVLELKSDQTGKALDRAIVSDPDIAALGHFVATLNPTDIGTFKTPSLRNVSVTGPYLHDGSVATLEEVIDTELYVRGAAINYPIVLTPDEKNDLLAFLGALTTRAGQLPLQ